MEALSKETKREGSKGSVVISTITPPWSSSLPVNIRTTWFSAGDEDEVKEGDDEGEVIDNRLGAAFKLCSPDLLI